MKRKTLTRLACILTMGFVWPGFGQEKIISWSNLQWLQYYNQLQLSGRWNLQGDIGFRWRDGFAERHQYILRIGAGFKINPAFQLGGGVAHLGNYGESGLVQVEFRPYQDLGYSMSIGNSSLQHRLRLEERFLNPVVNGHIGTPNSFALRIRYSLMASIPLFRSAPDNPLAWCTLKIGDEIFLGTQEDFNFSIPFQNRITISPTFQWSRNLAISLTYCYQTIHVSDPDGSLRTNIIWLQIRHFIALKPKNENG